MDERLGLIYTELPFPLHRPGRLHSHGPLHQPHLHISSPAPSPPPQQTGTHVSCLYPEILALIFSYLDVRDKGRAAQVCSAWREASFHKSVWRGVEAKLHLRRANPALFGSLVRRGIRRVQVLSLKRSLKDVIQGIPNLVSLNLRGCYNVTDLALMNAISQELPSITRLDLSLCKQISDGSIGRFYNLKNLEVLDLGGCCNVTNTGLMLIACSLKNLRWLNLRSCWHISYQGIAHIAGVNEDNRLYEALAFVPGVSKDNVDGNSNLEYLGLQDCQRISDEALKHISSGLTRLKSINLSFCVCITDSGLKYLAKMASLKELNLRSCDNISDIGMAYLAEGGSRISSLDVSFCDKIGDQALIHISQGLFNLKSLSLSACQITDDGLLRISKTLHDLDTLNIGQCDAVTDKGLLAVAESLKQLKSIDLYGCTRITSDGIQNIMRLPNLVGLNLGLWQGSNPAPYIR